MRTNAQTLQVVRQLIRTRVENSIRETLVLKEIRGFVWRFLHLLLEQLLYAQFGVGLSLGVVEVADERLSLCI